MIVVKSNARSLARRALMLVQRLKTALNRPPEITTFTANGSYTIPVGAKRLQVTVINGGNGGARGAKVITTGGASAGNGGTAGRRVDYEFLTSSLVSPIPITVGIGGTGAPGLNTVSSTANGTPGTASSFGDYLGAVVGTNPLTSGVVLSHPDVGSTGGFGPGSGSVGGSKNNNTTSTSGGSSYPNFNDSLIPLDPPIAVGGSSGTITGGNGGNGADGQAAAYPFFNSVGGAGGGGTHVNNASAGNGGNGIGPGAGGGGGGGVGTGTGFSGSGGNGGPGIVVIVAHFT